MELWHQSANGQLFDDEVLEQEARKLCERPIFLGLGEGVKEVNEDPRS